MSASPELLYASIAEVGTRYRAGTLSPIEVTASALARIESLNPTLNAFITVTAERALAAAEQAERELRSGLDRGPLHGIPVAVKDLVDTADIRTTAGSTILTDNIPGADAPLVHNLKQAGAVLMGKTNLLEFAYGIVHPAYGATWNPWDTSRTAGGSSGGSAAAVASGMCYAAFGTDTGGSIRIPASYCGIAGLKPTYGLVDLAGVFPLSWSLDHGGPMARSSADAATMLDALLGKRSAPLNLAALKELRLGILVEHRHGPEMEPAVSSAFDAACARLQEAGASLHELSIPHLDLADGVLLSIIGPEASAIHARWMAERPQEYAPLTRQQLELGYAIPAVVHVRAQQYRRYLTSQFLAALEDVDAILSPTAPWVAPHEDPAVVGDEGASEARRTAPYNLTGLPALTLPCGFDDTGLPIGLQIGARPGADSLLLAIGAAFEQLSPEIQIKINSLQTMEPGP